MRGSMATPAEFEGCKALYVGNLHPYVNEVCLQVKAARCPALMQPCTQRGAIGCLQF